MKKSITIITFIGYGFAAIAFLVFLYSFFITNENIFKEQAIYWFYTSLVASLIPQIRQFKYKDIEVVFREQLKRVEENIDKRVEKLENEFLMGLEQVRAHEATLSPDYKKWRSKVFNGFAKHLHELSPEKRLGRQEAFTRNYLKALEISLPQVKEVLNQLGYYSGEIDDNFSDDTARAIESFQKDNNIHPVDGIFGTLTYGKLAEMMKSGQI